MIRQARSVLHYLWNTCGGKTIRIFGKKDSRQAVEQGLPVCFARLWRFCVALTGQRDLADDLAQMTCLRALEKSAQFTPGTHLDRWLFVMARRLWLNELRKNSVRAAAGFAHMEDTDVADQKPATETNIFAREVFAKVNELPEAQRVTALLVFVEGYKYAEAADILDIPIGTVMSRISSARKALAAQLEEATGTDS